MSVYDDPEIASVEESRARIENAAETIRQHDGLLTSCTDRGSARLGFVYRKTEIILNICYEYTGPDNFKMRK